MPGQIRSIDGRDVEANAVFWDSGAVSIFALKLERPTGCHWHYFKPGEKSVIEEVR